MKAINYMFISSNSFSWEMARYNFTLQNSFKLSCLLWIYLLPLYNLKCCTCKFYMWSRFSFSFLFCFIFELLPALCSRITAGNTLGETYIVWGSNSNARQAPYLLDCNSISQPFCWHYCYVLKAIWIKKQK